MVVYPESEGGQIQLSLLSIESGQIQLSLLSIEGGQIQLSLLSIEGGQIQLSLVTIRLLPAVHFDWLNVSSLLKPIFMFFFLNLLLPCLFCLYSFDIQPLGSQHMTMPNSTAIANWSFVYFEPNINIKSPALFLSELYITHCSHHGFLCKIISSPFKQRASHPSYTDIFVF